MTPDDIATGITRQADLLEQGAVPVADVIGNLRLLASDVQKLAGKDQTA